MALTVLKKQPHCRLLLVDDDSAFCQVLALSLRGRGFRVRVAHSVPHALRLAQLAPPDYAIIDLRVGKLSGLPLIAALKGLREHTKIVMLTGYASVATAIEAIKLGATHYLAKPVEVEDIIAAFSRQAGNPATVINDRPLSVEHLEWEYIQKTLLECQGSVTVSAQRLGLHRRTLQRKLRKCPGGGQH